MKKFKNSRKTVEKSKESKLKFLQKTRLIFIMLLQMVIDIDLGHFSFQSKFNDSNMTLNIADYG